MDGGTDYRDDPARPKGGIGFPRTLQLLVRDKNIHQDTLLATDYLNHFNEIIMLLGLVSDMPECVDDVREWQPKTYAQHFVDTSFADKDLAILAYENAPQRYRKPFDDIVTQMDEVAVRGIEEICAAADAGDQTGVGDAARRVTQGLQRLVDVASAIIHGRELTAEQSEIDALMSDDPDDHPNDGAA